MKIVRNSNRNYIKNVGNQKKNIIITYKIITHEPVYRILGTDILLGGSSKGVAKVLAKHLLLLKLGISEGTYVTDVDIFYVANMLFIKNGRVTILTSEHSEKYY